MGLMFPLKVTGKNVKKENMEISHAYFMSCLDAAAD